MSYKHAKYQKHLNLEEETYGKHSGQPPLKQNGWELQII